MGLKLSAAVCLTLIAVQSATAGDGLWTSIHRYFGYGFGDGYHANRCCEGVCSDCAGASEIIAPPPEVLAPQPAPRVNQSPPDRLPPVTMERPVLPTPVSNHRQVVRSAWPQYVIPTAQPAPVIAPRVQPVFFPVQRPVVTPPPQVHSFW